LINSQYQIYLPIGGSNEAIDALSGTNNVKDAADIFEAGFEARRTLLLSSRINYANKVLREFGT
jgi:hypothetical protein